MNNKVKTVGLLVTCLVDMFRPEIGFDALKLLRDAGYVVHIPKAQTCCGQVAYNSGDRVNALAVARDVLALFSSFDYVVVPSGSCAGMLRHHYLGLFAEKGPERVLAQALANKTYELTSFLTDVAHFQPQPCIFPQHVTYHDSCSSKREMGVCQQPRQLLGSLTGLRLSEAADSEECCGFGGTFCVKYGAISTRMADNRIAAFEATGADLVLGGDLGCLLNLAGRLSRKNSRLSVRHVAEVLAKQTGLPPAIAKGDSLA